MSIEVKIDQLIKCQSLMQNDVKEIKTVLAGDDYGNEGLVKDHKELKDKFYKLREDVRKFKIIGGVLSFILGGVITVISIFK